ncbi:Ig-like domain-containing protein, partial [Enterobacteriaceae bacterium C34L]
VNGSAFGVSPASVTLTQAPPVVANSSLTVSPASIVADGSASTTVTLTLKDINSHGVKGQTVAFTTTGTAVTLSGVTDHNDGTYTATLTGTAALTGTAQISATVNGSAFGVSPASVTLTQIPPVVANSSLTVSPASIVADGSASTTVTLTLKDTNSNGVKGQTVAFTTTGTAVTLSGVTDHNDGTYTATLTGTTGGTAQISATVNGSAFGVSPASVTLTLADEPPESISTQVNTHTFAVSSENGTFPTTGFAGASFTLVPKNGASAANYTWVSDASWVTVTNGVVTFTGKGSGDRVTITGTPSNNQGKIIKYSFALNAWFINNSSTALNWADAGAYCSSHGYSQPTLEQMTLHSGHTPTFAREAGALWNEWGNLTRYSGAGFSAEGSWSSEEASGGNHYYVSLGNGEIYSGTAAHTPDAVCRQGL